MFNRGDSDFGDKTTAKIMNSKADNGVHNESTQDTSPKVTAGSPTPLSTNSSINPSSPQK